MNRPRLRRLAGYLERIHLASQVLRGLAVPVVVHTGRRGPARDGELTADKLPSLGFEYGGVSWMDVGPGL